MGGGQDEEAVLAQWQHVVIGVGQDHTLCQLTVDHEVFPTHMRPMGLERLYLHERLKSLWKI